MSSADIFIRQENKDNKSCLILDIPENTDFSAMPVALQKFIGEYFQFQSTTFKFELTENSTESPQLKAVGGRKLFSGVIYKTIEDFLAFTPMLEMVGWDVIGLQSYYATEDVSNGLDGDEGIITRKPKIGVQLTRENISNYLVSVDENGVESVSNDVVGITVVDGSEKFEVE